MFKRIPSKRALAALAKLRGYRVERSWPYLIRARGRDLNFHFEDVLEYQYARTRDFVVLVVGAFDGISNDPVSNFVRTRKCRGILIEPQKGAFARLQENYRAFAGFTLLNVAVGENSGVRTLYTVRPGSAFPSWVAQLASFDPTHIGKHEDAAPGVGAHVDATEVETISFDDLLDRYELTAIDVLQIDAEGLDGQLLSWFPFGRLRPAVVHFEHAHLGSAELEQVRARLRDFGYRLMAADSREDEVAILAS